MKNQKITPKTLLEKGLKISYSKVWGGLFPSLDAEIQISSFFGSIGFIVGMVSIYQQSEILLIIIPGFVFVVCAIFGAFKVHRLFLYQNYNLNKVHFLSILNNLNKEKEKIEEDTTPLSSFLEIKKGQLKELENQISSIEDAGQEQDDLPPLKEQWERLDDEKYEIEMYLKGYESKLAPIIKEIDGLKILFSGDELKIRKITTLN